jgi:UDP-N-acetylmuramate--alanine ligase
MIEETNSLHWYTHMEINGIEVKKAYFIGIGGIGMSALAQLMQDHGVAVCGSDREASPVTELLHEKSIPVAIGQQAENIPTVDLVVYSEAVWEDNPERIEAKRRGIPQVSYFTALGEAAKGKKTIAVAGTHGKTTTTGMLARILKEAGVSPSAVVGSLVRDFGSNYLSGTSEWLVVEACEYKRDFLTLSPHILVITNIEFDHTDYYKDLADVQSAFAQLIAKVPADGAVVTDVMSASIAPLVNGIAPRVIDYTSEPVYDIKLPGEFNIMNARAAAAAARATLLEIPDDSIVSALGAFEGTWRRFEYKGKTKAGADVYDDYAHHPTAVKKTLIELKKRTKGKLYVAFHPHLYSRTRDLLDDFATAFTDADGVFIAPIYAAREEDDGSISSTMLAKLITKNGTTAEALSFDEIQAAFEKFPKKGDTVVTMGAGDIYKVADALIA